MTVQTRLFSLSVSLAIAIAALNSGRSYGAAIAPNDPSIAGSLQMWLQSSSISQSNGTAVTTWVDSSGMGNNATTTQPSDMPTFTTNATPSGQAGLSFNGTSNVMTLTPAIAETLASPGKSVFIVGDVNNAGAYGRFITTFDAPLPAGNTIFNISSDPAGASPGSTSPEYEFFDRVSGTDIFLGTITPGSFDVLAGAVTGTAGGTITIPTQSITSTGNYGEAYLGGIWPVGYDGLPAPPEDLNGTIASVLVYDTALTASQMAGVEQYLINTYMTAAPTHASVPEPATATLALIGLAAGIALWGRRRFARRHG